MKNPALFLALPLVEKIFNVLLIGILKGMGQPHRHSNSRGIGVQKWARLYLKLRKKFP